MKIKISYCFLIPLLCISLATKCKGQANNYWHFTYKNAIKFDNYPPSIINNSQLATPNWIGGEACGTMTDNNGNLLYYNNGDSVWNRNNISMPNGYDLCTANSSGYYSLSIPFVNDSNRYYIFQSSGYFGTFPNFYNINVVNMSLNGGLGDVEVKNDILYYNSSDRLTATKTANGLDYWLITHPQLGNSWKVFKISCTGIDRLNPVVSNAGSSLASTDYLTDFPTLKISTDGKLIATNFLERGYIELYQFNNATGTVSNPIKIIGQQSRTRTFEFSPDSKQLYLFSDNPSPSFVSALNQYDVSVYDSATIANSRVTIAQGFNLFYTSGQMQTAIDKRIYIATLDNYLHIIENPNVHGTGCNFLYNGLPITNQSWSLPYSVPSTNIAQNVRISYTVAADCRTVTFTGKTYIKGNNLTFKWKWGQPPPIGGTPLDSATQVVASQGDTTYTTIVHTYPTGQDTFFVNLTVSSDTLCGTGRAGTRVVLTPASPKPTANFGYATACNNLTVAFTDSSLLNTNPTIIYQYAWKPATAPPTAYANYSTQSNNSFTFAAYDSFDVRLIVKGTSTGCAPGDTLVKRVVLKPKPVAASTLVANCGSLQASFSSTATIAAGTITQQEYYLGNTLIGTGASFVYSFAAYGTYIIKQVVKSNLNCISDTAFKTVAIENYPVASFTAQNGCVGKTITIANNSIPNNPTVNYSWTTSDGQTSTALLPNFSFAASGTKLIQLKVSSPTGGCFSTNSQTITIDDNPTAAFDILEACLGRNLIINNNSTGTIASYAWQTSNAQQSSSVIPTFIFNTPGNYSIKLDVATANNCSATITKSTPIQPVQLVLRPATEVNVVTGQPLQLNITGAANYNWLPFTNLTNANSSNPVFRTTLPGIYPLTVQATTAQGCKANASLTIKVFAADNYLLIPNAFTPDGNALNDKFNFTCAGLQSLSFFRVYNRYGQLVYQTNTCSNNGWNGSFGGKAQPGGAYVYNWQGVTFNGQTVSGNGSVILVR